MSLDNRPVYTGGCQCGRVRFRVEGALGDASVCHCRMCQKAVGGPFKPWANVRVANFAWTRGTPGTFRSSSAAERGFCPRCGTSLYFAYIKRPESISVTVGSLDTPGAVQLTQVDGIESRLANFDPAVLAGLAARPTSEGSPPENLSRIVNFQHPDHDTPSDWHPPPG